jgi:hypothetical protein
MSTPSDDIDLYFEELRSLLESIRSQVLLSQLRGSDGDSTQRAKTLVLIKQSQRVVHSIKVELRMLDDRQTVSRRESELKTLTAELQLLKNQAQPDPFQSQRDLDEQAQLAARYEAYYTQPVKEDVSIPMSPFLTENEIKLHFGVSPPPKKGAVSLLLQQARAAVRPGPQNLPPKSEMDRLIKSALVELETLADISSALLQLNLKPANLPTTADSAQNPNSRQGGVPSYLSLLPASEAHLLIQVYSAMCKNYIKAQMLYQTVLSRAQSPSSAANPLGTDEVNCRPGDLIVMVAFLAHACCLLSLLEAWMGTGNSDFFMLVGHRLKEKSHEAAERARTRLERTWILKLGKESAFSASGWMLDAVAIDVSSYAFHGQERILARYALRLADLRRDVLTVKNDLTAVAELYSIPMASESMAEGSPSPTESSLQEQLLPIMEREAAEIVLELEQLHAEVKQSIRDVTTDAVASTACRLLASARVTALALDVVVRTSTGEGPSTTTTAAEAASQIRPWFGLSDGLEFSRAILLALKRRTIFNEVPSRSIREITEQLQSCK